MKSTNLKIYERTNFYKHHELKCMYKYSKTVKKWKIIFAEGLALWTRGFKYGDFHGQNKAVNTKMVTIPTTLMNSKLHIKSKSTNSTRVNSSSKRWAVPVTCKLPDVLLHESPEKYEDNLWQMVCHLAYFKWPWFNNYWKIVNES